MAKQMSKQWFGEVPEKDSFGEPITTTFIDGATFSGPWAIMTPRSFKMLGVGLGLGRGQKYEKQNGGVWLKVEG